MKIEEPLSLHIQDTVECLLWNLVAAITKLSHAMIYLGFGGKQMSVSFSDSSRVVFLTWKWGRVGGVN